MKKAIYLVVLFVLIYFVSAGYEQIEVIKEDPHIGNVQTRNLIKYQEGNKVCEVNIYSYPSREILLKSAYDDFDLNDGMLADFEGSQIYKAENSYAWSSGNYVIILSPEMDWSKRKYKEYSCDELVTNYLSKYPNEKISRDSSDSSKKESKSLNKVQTQNGTWVSASDGIPNTNCPENLKEYDPKSGLTKKEYLYLVESCGGIEKEPGSSQKLKEGNNKGEKLLIEEPINRLGMSKKTVLNRNNSKEIKVKITGTPVVISPEKGEELKKLHEQKLNQIQRKSDSSIASFVDKIKSFFKGLFK